MRERIFSFLDRFRGTTRPRTVFTKNGREEIEVEMPPTVTELALDVGVRRETLWDWAKDDEEISNYLSRVKEEYERVLVANGLTDRYNANLAKFLLSSDHNKREKADVTTDGKELGIVFLPQKK